MDKRAQDFCTDCSQTKRFTRRWFNKTAVGGALIAVGVLSIEKDVIRNAMTRDKTVPMTQQQLQEWIKSPGLIDAYPDQSPVTRQAIKDGDWQRFQGTIYTEPPKPGVADAACGYYWSYGVPTSCCQSSDYKCYQCNGETQWCTLLGRYSHNNCAWCGGGPHCCG